VEVRQLRQMNGHASFNEVFMTDAVVHPEDMVGEEGGGWKVALTTLSHERSGFARSRESVEDGGRTGRIYDEYREEVAVANEPYVWYPQRAGRVDLVIERAKETGAIDDPVIRQDIARLLAMHQSAQWYARRTAEARKAGRTTGAEGSISKIAASDIARLASDVHTAITGIDAMLTGPDSPEDGIIAEILVSVPAVSIAGGTDEIQRNIVAERLLDMPKEPRFDTGPFRDVKRN
jgi:alkylation response protein AidB-like acyl-CoA dehydrogenase